MAYSLEIHPLFMARYVVRITEIMSCLECHTREKVKCFRSARHHLPCCLNTQGVTHCQKAPSDPEIKSTGIHPTGEIRGAGIPLVAKPGGPSRFWLKAT